MSWMYRAEFSGYEIRNRPAGTAMSRGTSCALKGAICSSVHEWSGPGGVSGASEANHGACSGSNGRTGLSRNCRMYQSVLPSERFTTETSCRTPSTSCTYHSGNVSLSPLVNTIP